MGNQQNFNNVISISIQVNSHLPNYHYLGCSYDHCPTDICLQVQLSKMHLVHTFELITFGSIAWIFSSTKVARVQPQALHIPWNRLFQLPISLLPKTAFARMRLLPSRTASHWGWTTGWSRKWWRIRRVLDWKAARWNFLLYWKTTKSSPAKKGDWFCCCRTLGHIIHIN